MEPWNVTSVTTLKAAEKALSQRLFDLEIIDRNLPDGEGLQLVEWQRKAGVRTPIVVLTDRSDLASRLQGLDRLADQYLGKPYDVNELLAVIRAATWRNRQDGLLNCGKLEVSFQGRGSAFYCGRELDLSREKELAVIALLALMDPEPVTREMLLRLVWNDRASNLEGDKVAPTLSRLRSNLSREGVPPEIIETVPSGGWKLNQGLLQQGQGRLK
ncbi:MAG: response regulator transcription factor [Negativicutes bacterium]|nr:response regulator transcription factor [Negativicutes bacterium]